MPRAYTQNFYHMVFNTKHRQSLIAADLEERLYPFMGGILRDLRCSLIAIDGVQRSCVPPTPEDAGIRRVCRYCGYSLSGLEAENKEYRCPECGRHTPAVEVGAEEAPS